MSSSKTEKNLMKNVITSVRYGPALDVSNDIEKWAKGSPPLPDWDLLVGPAFWNRCVDKNIASTEEETDALASIYRSLVVAFISNSDDTEHYLDRIKVFAATLKYFVVKGRMDLAVIESLLQEISRSSYYVRQHEFSSFKSVCMNFYALIWNYMRENHSQFGLLESLAHASLSVRWLVVLGLEQFQNISHKLSQISFLLAKNQVHTNAMIADFFLNLSTQIVELLKQVIFDDSNNGLKVKKRKCILPASQFHGILNITFVLTRQLAIYGDFEKAVKVFRPITSVAQIYFETDLRQMWKSVLESFVKICMVVTKGVDVRTNDDIMNSSEAFRECRKQILDMSFQKSYPGYAFSFMYAFSESIGFVITNTKNASGSSLLRNIPLSKCTKFLKEIQLAADACVVLDDIDSDKHVLEGVTESRKVEVHSTALFHVLKVASERISDKEVEIEKDFQQVTEAAFRTLMTLGNKSDVDVLKSAELFNIITFHTCNIGFAYQKRKNHREAVSWCYRSIDAYEAFKSKNVQTDLKINVLTVGLLLADCHRQLENYTEGTRWLAKWLVLAPKIVESQSTAYDIYEQIPWTDWSVHWLSLQKEICSRDSKSCRSVVEYLEEDDPTSFTDEFASKALRLEMNAYFSGRQAVVPAILNVGRELEERKFSLADQVLGLVCQAIGLWWVGKEEALEHAAKCLQDAINILDEPRIRKIESLDASDEILRTYLTGIVMSWKALCIWRINQIISEMELETLKDRLLQENPTKKDKVDGLYAVPAFTSLTVEDETMCANNFIEATECFYQLSQMEGVFKSVVDSHCPALAQITVRLTAMGLTALGDKIHAAKAWYSTYVTAKVYDRKGLVVLAASEVLKIAPHISMECVEYAGKVNAEAQEGNLIRHNKGVFYRLDLAKAVACYHQKNFNEGLQHLVEVYKFLAEKDNFDSTHHLMAEADYVLSLYRSISQNQKITFPAGIPELLCKMTPAGLAVKSYKLLGGLSRETDVQASGWTDMLHNHYLLGSIAEVSVRTIKLLKETGKLRDLKSFVTDTIYFYQRLGAVSRSVGLLIPLIEMDISARNFYMAQIRIAAVAKVLLSSAPKPEEKANNTFSEAKKFLENNLKIPGLSITRLEHIANLKWNLQDIEATSFHYRNRSSKYLSSLKVDCEAINIKSFEMKPPDFLRHPLTCCCYTCSHPEIIPSVLEFLVAQCKYAVVMKWKVSMAVLEIARLYHQRAMFRILFNMEKITDQLQPIVPRKVATKILHMMYSWFFFTPGFIMQLTNMEICPVDDVSYIVHLMNTALRATDLIDDEDLHLKVLPLEMGTCALYEYLVSKKRISISGGNIREVIQLRIEQQEKENTVLVPSSPDVMESSLSPIAPPVMRKRAVNPPLTKQLQYGRKAAVTSLRPRRILNSKAQQQQPQLSATVELIDLTEVENIPDERRLPIIRPPNFDDSNGD